jgi:hypothetical protein
MLMRVMSKGRRLGRGNGQRALRVFPVALLTLLCGLQGSGAAAPVAGPKAASLCGILLPGDCTPPSAPAVTVTDVGPTHVSLAWSASDNTPHLWYTVYQNAVPIYPLIGSETATAYLLMPGGTYTFTVRALDFGGNFSPLSAPVTVTTPGFSSVDNVPPSTPGQIFPDVFDNEISLRWLASSDNHDPPELIAYEVWLNGELVDVAVGGATTAVVYGVNGLNLVSIVAVDSSGNTSAAISVTVAVEF